jgi:serine/threonine protein kinase
MQKHFFPTFFELQIMRKLEHQNIVKLKYFFYSAGEKVSSLFLSEIENLYCGESYSMCNLYGKLIKKKIQTDNKILI